MKVKGKLHNYYNKKVGEFGVIESSFSVQIVIETNRRVFSLDFSDHVL